MIGWVGLKAIWLSLAFLFWTMDWTQMGLYLSQIMSYTWTFPSVVTAAKVVLEKGAQATSPTGAPRSKV